MKKKLQSIPYKYKGAQRYRTIICQQIGHKLRKNGKITKNIQSSMTESRKIEKQIDSKEIESSKRNCQQSTGSDISLMNSTKYSKSKYLPFKLI